jgi:hypothetical protein
MEVFDQLHRALDVREQRRHRLALAFDAHGFNAVSHLHAFGRCRGLGTRSGITAESRPALLAEPSILGIPRAAFRAAAGEPASAANAEFGVTGIIATAF